MAKATGDEIVRARAVFEAWAKAQRGMGLLVLEAEESGSNPVPPGERATLVPYDWDDLDGDQQEVWVDTMRAARADDQQEILDLKDEVGEKAIEHDNDLMVIGERLGLVEGDDCTSAKIVERIQQLLTELQNSTRTDILCSELKLPRRIAPYSMQEIVDAVGKKQWLVVWSEPYSDSLSWTEVFHSEEEARAALDSPEHAGESKAVLVSGVALETEDRT